MINNQSTITGTAESANGGNVENGSSESIQIEGVDSSKSVYAIDGTTNPDDLTVAVGDTVTFAIDINLDTLDNNGLVITDYLPLPVFEAMAPTFTDTGEGTSIPGVGEWGFGPDTDFENWPDDYLDGSNVTTSADAGNNSITWTLDGVNQLDSIGGTVQILFTVEVLDQPFTDGLFLTNVSQITISGTDETVTLPPDGIQIEVVSPEVNITKGVIGTDDGSGVFDPEPTGPVTFDPAGSAGDGEAPWTGDITSQNLDDNPIDSNLSEVDAGDTVRFAITLENTGGSDAFNLVIGDTLPDGFEIPPGGLNLQVYTGDGTPVSFSGDLFNGGITLDDPSADEGALNEGRDPDTGPTTDGSNIIVITYDLIAINEVQPGQIIENTATIEEYGGVDEGNDYTDGSTNINWQDDATVTLRENDVSKTLDGTSINGDNNADNEAVIGEVITYTLTLTIAEGVTPSASIVDTLDDGLVFLGITDVTTSSSDLTSTVPLTPEGLAPTINGQQVIFDLGDLNNVDRDNTVAETITITYQVLVANDVVNQSGDQLNNSADFIWDTTADDIDNPTINDTDSAEVVNVIEPDLQVDKSITSSDPIIDAGDPIQYTIVISHSAFSDTDAFDATFIDTLPPELTSVSLASATLTVNGVDTDVSSLFVVNGNTIEMAADASFDLLLGDTLTLVINANVVNDAILGTDVINTGTVDWESINGDDENERTGEDGAGGELDDYESDGSAQFTIASVEAGKSIVNSSVDDEFNGLTEAVIGEEVTYQVSFEVPEGVVINAQILDTLPAGMEFISFDEIIIGDDLLITPSDGFGAPTETVNGDGTTTLDFGTASVANNGTDDVPDLITLVYTVRVTNEASNQAGVELTNNAQFITNEGTSEASTTVTVIEPQLLIDKSANITQGDNGDAVSYTITLTNPDDGNSTTAYDISFIDQLPEELTNVTFSATLELGGGTSDVTSFFTYDPVTNQLAIDPQAELDIIPGTTITITINGILSDTIAGDTITNNAETDWSSLDGDADGERTGDPLDPGGALNDYTTDDSVDITVIAPQVDKVLVSTSQNDSLNDDTEATIGEIVTFSITITVPEASLAGQITDVYGPGFEFIDLVGVTVSDPDAIQFNPEDLTTINDPDNNTVGFDFGTLVNTDTDNTTAETITITYRLRVTDIPDNVDGITLNNDATLDYDTDGDGTDEASISDNASVDVVEPLLNIDKELLSETPLVLGGIATFQITVQLDPASGGHAYDVTIEDLLPPYLSEIEGIQIDTSGGSPTIDDNSTDNLLSLEVSEIDPSTVITITVDARVTTDLAAVGQTTTNVADAEYSSLDTPDGGDDSDIEREYDDSDEVTAEIGAVDLFVDKDDGGIDVDNPAAPGDTITYTINYGNNGTVDATGVVITESLPDYVIYDPTDNPGWVLDGDTLTFDIGDLAAGETGSVQLIVTVIDPLPSGVEETNNTVSIDGDETNGPDPTPEDNTDTDVTPLEAAPDYVIDKIENFDDPANPGDTIEWTIVVTNEGNQDGTGVVVTDTLPTGDYFSAGFTASDGGVIDLDAGTVTWEIGDLAVGESVTLTLSTVVDESVPTDIPTQTNSVVVDDDGTNGPDPTPDNNRDDEDFDITYVDLAIDKDDAGITAEPGDTVVYTLNYANNGTADATGVVITESLPEYATFDADSSTAGWIDNGDGTFSFEVGDVAAGATGSVEFAVIIDDPIPTGVEETSNTTSIEDDGTQGPDQNLEDNDDDEVTPIDGRPDYVIDKIENFDDPAAPGETISWDIVVTNEGNQDGTGVVVTDTLPTGDFFDAGFIASDGGIVDLDAGTVTWNIGDLAAGESVTLTLTTTVNENVPPVLLPTQVNSVEVTDDGTNGPDPTPENNVDDEEFDITLVDLSITKVDDFDPTTPGGTIIYTLEYANIGGFDAEDTVITETLPDNVTFDAANSDPRWVDQGDGTFTLDLGTVVSGGDGSVAFAVIVDDPLPAGVDEILNNTEIDYGGGNGPDQNLSNNTDDETTEIIAQPDYVLDKIENFDDPANPGDTIEWTIVVTNEGNQDGTGVVITDNLPSTELFSEFTASDGGVIDLDAGTVTWDIGDLAVGESVSVTLSGVIVEQLPGAFPPQANAAEVTDDGTNGPDPTPENNSDLEDLDITFVDLAIEKNADTAVTAPGEVVTYELSYSNLGTSVATGAVITETIPENTTFDPTNSTPGWVLNGNEITFEIGEVGPGERGTVVFAVIVDSPLPAGVTEFPNVATITDDGDNGPDQNLDNNSSDDQRETVINVVAAPDYVIDKVENFDDPVNPGDPVDWTIVVSNEGNQDGTGVVVTDTLPDTSLFNSFVASNGGVIDLAAGTVTWNIGDLAAGDTVTLTLSAVVNESVPTNIPTQTNSVVVEDDGNNGEDPTPENNRDKEDLEITYVDLFIDKDYDGPVPEPTDTIVYTLTYGNRGTAPSTGVVITETLPPNTSFDAANSTPGWVQNGDTFTFDAGTLAPGEEATISFAVTIDYPLDATVQQIDNTTVITDDGGNGPDQNLVDNTDTDEIEIRNDTNVDNITLSQLHGDYIYPPREWERMAPELHGRLISNETQDVSTNLQGGRSGGNYDPAFGAVDGRYYPNDWSRVFSNDLSIDTSDTGGEKSSPLQLDEDTGRYRANSLFGDFVRPAASPELPAGAPDWAPGAEPLPSPLQSSPPADEPLNLQPERSQLQQQLDDITREMNESRVSPLLVALAELSAEEARQQQAK